MLYLLFCLTLFHVHDVPKTGDTCRITYNGDCMTIDGRDQFVYSAAFHYFRVPRPLWRDRLQKIRDAGCNTVETYIPWNINELNMPSGIHDTSRFDFSELEAFLKMASDEMGLNVIVRPGPFICAEWAGGGYPRWLAKFRPARFDDEFWLRSDDSVHVRWCLHWFDAVNKVVAKYQITRKPRGSKGVIMVQIENEYDAQNAKNKVDFLRALYRSVRGAGVTVPVFTCLTAQCRGSKDDVLRNVFDAENLYVGLRDAPGCARRMEDLRLRQPEAPAFVTELQGGWFSTVGGRLSEDHESDYRHYRAIALMAMLGGATGLNTYMFAGGTNFSGWGARGQTTTYDYNAPIHENGLLSAKYQVAKSIGAFIDRYGQALLHAKGGACKVEGGPASLYGGVRVATDGTRFVFLHNNDPEKSISGTVTLLPGVAPEGQGPLYNIDQNGKKVLIKDGPLRRDSAGSAVLMVSYRLDGLGTKVLVIPPGGDVSSGSWFFGERFNDVDTGRKAPSIRVAKVLTRDDDYRVKWMDAKGESLPEVGVNDCRYVLYRSDFLLQEPKTFTRLLLNTFSRDIIDVEVNGRIATRLAPDEKYAARATRDVQKSFTVIKADEFDNAFDVAGLLRKGANHIVALYENIGHEHGYVPMEELCGIRRAGLSDTLAKIERPLQWQLTKNVSGVAHRWMDDGGGNSGWSQVPLDTTMVIPRKGHDGQPVGNHDALMTWYKADVELPAKRARPLKLLVNASGNGYIYLNGHNLGRYWEIGPQREFYLPDCWLNGGKNCIAIGLCQTANGGVLRAMEIASY